MPLITFVFSLLFVDLSIAGYVLEDDYSVSNFFDMFTFFTSSDPTNGFVDYVDQATAQSAGYIGTTASTIYIGADHQNVTSGGRPSVRLTSNNAYNAGSLIILDLEHMPGGICGTWPAFWMVGPDWPSGGEIDIIEGVNLQTANAMTLHTSDGCSITNDGNFTGSMETDNCYIYAEGQTTNAGCSIDSSDTETYGTGFNDIGGGVYATEWTDDSISIWFFPRSAVPSDIAAGTPSPSSSWGTPAAQFEGGCDIPKFFQDNQLVFDLTFCGDWAGNVWSSSTCSSLADTCNDYVENNPTAFTDAYWTINSLRTYQYSADTSSSSSSSAAAAVSAALKQNQKRHLLQHRRRFGGFH
ncbi:concanavalin A-like lectin/glucanase domain-containing protein [Delphinella strobiligena]|nr:concanavalin A-like lectin/glucanase domain-containing protein [Delphinella strobiligena]